MRTDKSSAASNHFPAVRENAALSLGAAQSRGQAVGQRPRFGAAGVINHATPGDKTTSVKSIQANLESDKRERAPKQEERASIYGITAPRLSASLRHPADPLQSFNTPLSVPESVARAPIRGRRVVLLHGCQDSNTQLLGLVPA